MGSQPLWKEPTLTMTQIRSKQLSLEHCSVLCTVLCTKNVTT